jgi:putative tryptophan/tyrosine transport system substrate-binding protein
MRRPAMWLMVVLAFLALMATAENLRAANSEIAVMWVGKSGMTNRVLMGFMQRARTTAPDMTITLKRELKNMKDAETLFSQFESTMNGIVFLRSTGAKFLAKANPKVPCFIGGCNNPVYLGTVKNLNAPEGNITGVTYFIPYQEIFKLMLALFPNVKSVWILLEKGHPGAVIDQEGTREQCERFKLSYNEVVARSGCKTS